MTEDTIEIGRREALAIRQSIARVGQRVLIRKAAVLGAGVMGAQIAAHLANANVKPILFDLAAKEGKDKSAIANKAIDGLAKLNPSPIATAAAAKQIVAANYDEHLEHAARLRPRDRGHQRTHGLEEGSLRRKSRRTSGRTRSSRRTRRACRSRSSARRCRAELRRRFCGIHFFNPPRYMRLVELVPTPDTDDAVMLDRLETFLTTTLGKGVVRAKDTPNFVANRVGVFSMLATMHHTLAFKLGFDEVDALTGPAIGRAKSATYRTADVVGLDTMAHVIKTMADTLPDDPWHAYYKQPDWFAALVAKGALGQKTKAGIFTKKGKDILVLDVDKQDYRVSAGDVYPDVQAILKEKNPGEQLAKLRASTNPQAQFLWAIFRDLFHYVAVHLARHRALRSRRGLRDPLGFRLAARPLRAVAGGRLAAGCRLDRRGHRRRQDDDEGAASEMGHRWT